MRNIYACSTNDIYLDTYLYDIPTCCCLSVLVAPLSRSRTGIESTSTPIFIPHTVHTCNQTTRNTTQSREQQHLQPIESQLPGMPQHKKRYEIDNGPLPPIRHPRYATDKEGLADERKEVGKRGKTDVPIYLSMVGYLVCYRIACLLLLLLRALRDRRSITKERRYIVSITYGRSHT